MNRRSAILSAIVALATPWLRFTKHVDPKPPAIYQRAHVHRLTVRSMSAQFNLLTPVRNGWRYRIVRLKCVPSFDGFVWLVATYQAYERAGDLPN